ncbi:MAG: hypothetical protein NC102_06395 [Clostridium sp.]|nr:hypothetical protein [Clostridium sp.]
MEITEIIGQLKDKFGDTFDVAQVTEKLKGFDLKNMNMSEITSKLSGLVGDLDGDGVQEGIIDEIKGKIGGIFG